LVYEDGDDDDADDADADAGVVMMCTGLAYPGWSESAAKCWQQGTSCHWVATAQPLTILC